MGVMLAGGGVVGAKVVGAIKARQTVGVRLLVGAMVTETMGLGLMAGGEMVVGLMAMERIGGPGRMGVGRVVEYQIEARNLEENTCYSL